MQTHRVSLLLKESLAFAFLVIFLFMPLTIFAENTQLTIWSINPNTPFGELTDQMARRFSLDHDAFDLESVHYSNNLYKAILRAAMEERRAPDLFQNWGGGSIQPFVQRKEIIPLNRIEHKLRQNLLSVTFEPVTFEGKIYGVPYSGLTGVFFWYRKDIFKRYALSPPTTWQEFIAVGETLKKNGIVPIALPNKNKWPGSFYYMYLVDRIGGFECFKSAFERKNNQTFMQPAFIKAGELIQDLVKREFFPKGFNRMRDEPGNWNSMIITGQAGMYLMGTWFLSAINKLPAEIKSSFDFFEFPVIEGGGGDPHNLVGSPGQDYLSISAACKHPDAAMEFLSDFINSPHYFKELAAQGIVPPVKNAETYLSDPISRKIARAFCAARHVQLYYDQLLPQPLAEAHKLLIHELFELRLTPEEVARNHEILMLAPIENGSEGQTSNQTENK